MKDCLPRISIVFVTYERYATLKPTIESFLRWTDYPREKLELIVTDDGSRPETIAQIEALHVDVVITGGPRSGLGANANRGLAAASHNLVLQLQDDWQCDGPSHYLRSAAKVLTERPDIGLIHLNCLPKEHDIGEKCEIGSELIRVHSNLPDRKVAKVGDYAYSDWPHLKTRNFINVIGPYAEMVPMWAAELDYSRRCNAQTKLFLADFAFLRVFSHIGADLSYNTGSLTSRITKILRKNPIMSKMIDRLKFVLKK